MFVTPTAGCWQIGESGRHVGERRRGRLRCLQPTPRERLLHRRNAFVGADHAPVAPHLANALVAPKLLELPTFPAWAEPPDPTKLARCGALAGTRCVAHLAVTSKAGDLLTVLRCRASGQARTPSLRRSPGDDRGRSWLRRVRNGNRLTGGLTRPMLIVLVLGALGAAIAATPAAAHQTGNEGCTPGFWKNHPEESPIPNRTLEEVYNVPDAFGLDNNTLRLALASMADRAWWDGQEPPSPLGRDCSTSSAPTSSIRSPGSGDQPPTCCT